MQNLAWIKIYLLPFHTMRVTEIFFGCPDLGILTTHV